jgi:hypothetical protein
MSQSQGKLIQKRQRLLEELANLSLLLHASYLERFSTCARPNCKCHKGKKHGPRAYLAVYRDKKQRQLYVPQPERDAVVQGLRQYRKLEEMVQAITDINLQLMRAGHLGISQTKARKGGARHE